MNAARVAAILLVGMTLAVEAGTAAAQAPPAPRPDSGPPEPQRADNTFASLRLPYSIRTQGEPVEVVGKLVVHDAATLAKAAHVLIVLDPRSGGLKAELLEVLGPDGAPVTPENPEPAPKGGAKASFPPAALGDAGKEVGILARATPLTNGRHPMGVLVLAFDETWDGLKLDSGAPAEVYAEVLIGVTGLQGGFGAPPFTGSGNDIPDAGPAVAAVAALGAAAALGALRRRRRG